MKLLTVLISFFSFFSLAMLAQSVRPPEGAARPVPKIVLTNSINPFALGKPNPTPVLSAGGLSNLSIKANQPGLPGDTVWARGDGIYITATSVNSKVSKIAAEAITQQHTLSDREMNDLRYHTLNTMVFVQLILARTTATDTNLARFESKRRIDGMIKSAANEAVFWNTVAAAGYTQESFRQEKFEGSLMDHVIDREVKPLIRIPESDIHRYYDANEAFWAKPDQVRAAQIFFATVEPGSKTSLGTEIIALKRKKADETLAKLKAGGDFAALAKELSEDPESKDRGGEYTFQKKQMFAEFENAVWTLKAGEITGIINSQNGLHLFRKIEDVPSRIIPFNEVAEQIREGLVQQEMDVRIPEFSDRLRTAAHVVIVNLSTQPSGL
ncbi:MAG: hypothetical protein EXS25_03615 [Pedosphaera sp.]|nr:hypothetical protein [Pedosphaera sp.]